jgi:hypothetical protein
MKKLYKFYWDCGRQGDISGLFISDDKTISDNIGKNVYFGEVLGKHSEIFGYLEPKDLEEISQDQEFIKSFESIVGKSFGYNPLANINE